MAAVGRLSQNDDFDVWLSEDSEDCTLPVLAVFEYYILHSATTSYFWKTEDELYAVDRSTILIGTCFQKIILLNLLL